LLQAIGESPSATESAARAESPRPAVAVLSAPAASTRVSSPVASPLSAAEAPVPTEEWTGRLLDRGFSAAESAAIRGLPPAAIVRHATWLARRGRPIPLQAFLAPDIIDRWEAWHHTNGDALPPPDGEAAEGCWTLFLVCKNGQTQKSKESH
jgi:ATP-dependent DNA helicase RecQ